MSSKSTEQVDVSEPNYTPIVESLHNASVGDQPTDEDILGFEPYIKAIADFLTNPLTQPPLTLSVEGDWGSGKSSFMLQLQKELKKRNRRVKYILPLRRSKMLKALWKTRILKPIWRLLIKKRLEKMKILTVQFNAWRHDKEDALWAAFAIEFIRKLSRQLPLRHRLWAHSKLVFRRFKWEDGWLDVFRSIVAVIFFILVIKAGLTLYTQTSNSQLNNPDTIEKIPLIGQVAGSQWYKIIAWAIASGGITGVFVFVFSLLTKIKGFINVPFASNLTKHVQSPDYKNRVAFIELFHEDFHKIVRAYAGNRRVYVFIDDLDRCDVPKAADLMQALNLMISDAQQLIFILGMDREKVAAGLAVKYEKLLPYLTSTLSRADDRKSPVFDPLKGLEYGYAFIEKFIQLPFLVPRPVEADLNNLLNKLGSPMGISERVRRPGRIAQAFSKLRERFRKILPAKKNQGVNFNARSNDSEVAPTGDTKQPTGAISQERETLTDEQKKRREAIRFEINKESLAVRKIVLLVAPALENNPRRIKQFINLFRLRAFIAYETGLFDFIDDTPDNERLTLGKLGKFVAISLRWPLLLSDLDFNHKLLSNLQGLALGHIKADDLNSDDISRWSHRQDLKEFLRYGCGDDKGQYNSINEKLYTLADIDIDKLLQVSPRVIRPQPIPVQADQEPEQEAEHSSGTASTEDRSIDSSEKFERLKNKYKDVSFKSMNSTSEFTSSEANAVKIGLMRGVQHSVYAIYRVEAYLPLPMSTHDDQIYFEANKQALLRIKKNHLSENDRRKYNIHRIFIMSRDTLEDPDRVREIKEKLQEQSNAGFDVLIALKEELLEPPTYEFAIYDYEIVLRLNIDQVGRRYGEGIVYFDDAVLRDVYSRIYKDIEAESSAPEEFWKRIGHETR